MVKGWLLAALRSRSRGGQNYRGYLGEIEDSRATGPLRFCGKTVYWGLLKPDFSVSVDVERSLLRLTMIGFFDMETVARLADARNAAMKSLRCGANQHVTLCDAREGSLSTPEVSAEFQRLLGDPEHASRRLAYLTKRPLARVQTSRVLARKNLEFFEEQEPALAWLFEDAPPT